MLFNSIEFFIFFAIVYALYVWLADVRCQNRMLLFASYIFYGWWDVRFLYLVVLSTGLDYCCGLILGPGRIPRSDRLTVSICLLLAALAFVLPQWDAVVFHGAAPISLGATAKPGVWHAALPFGSMDVNFNRLLTPGWMGWSVLGGTIVAVLVANAIYFPLEPARAGGAASDWCSPSRPTWSSSGSSSISTFSSIAPTGCWRRSARRPRPGTCTSSCRSGSRSTPSSR